MLCLLLKKAYEEEKEAFLQTSVGRILEVHVKMTLQNPFRILWRQIQLLNI